MQSASSRRTFRRCAVSVVDVNPPFSLCDLCNGWQFYMLAGDKIQISVNILVPVFNLNLKNIKLNSSDIE